MRNQCTINSTIETSVRSSSSLASGSSARGSRVAKPATVNAESPDEKSWAFISSICASKRVSMRCASEPARARTTRASIGKANHRFESHAALGRNGNRHKGGGASALFSSSSRYCTRGSIQRSWPMRMAAPSAEGRGDASMRAKCAASRSANHGKCRCTRSRVAAEALLATFVVTTRRNEKVTGRRSSSSRSLSYPSSERRGRWGCAPLRRHRMPSGRARLATPPSAVHRRRRRVRASG